MAIRNEGLKSWQNLIKVNRDYSRRHQMSIETKRFLQFRILEMSNQQKSGPKWTELRYVFRFSISGRPGFREAPWLWNAHALLFQRWTTLPKYTFHNTERMVLTNLCQTLDQQQHNSYLQGQNWLRRKSVSEAVWQIRCLSVGKSTTGRLEQHILTPSLSNAIRKLEMLEIIKKG